MFNGVGLLLTREDTGWSEKEIKVTTSDEIRACFENTLGEVWLDAHRRIYYSVTERGIDAKARDIHGDMHYMSSPILLIECNDKEPIRISNNIKNSIKETIDFF
jgi:hypothetical protein